MLILLQKTGKPLSPLSSFHLIVLLCTVWKPLLLVVLAWMSDKVIAFLPTWQSGFHHGSSTTDVIWSYPCPLAGGTDPL